MHLFQLNFFLSVHSPSVHSCCKPIFVAQCQIEISTLLGTLCSRDGKLTLNHLHFFLCSIVSHLSANYPHLALKPLSMLTSFISALLQVAVWCAHRDLRDRVSSRSQLSAVSRDCGPLRLKVTGTSVYTVDL